MTGAGDRFASLDAARGVLMMLGVVLHASNIYAVDGAWLVRDVQRAPAFDLIGSAVHVFRMPAFFWISGFFTAFTFLRDGPAGLLRKRLLRIGLPLLTSWATLNVATAMLVANLRGRDPLGVWQDRVPLYHLWFLVDLAIFVLLAALILPRLGALRRHGAVLGSLGLALLLAAVTLFTALVDMAARTTGVGYVDIFGLTTLYRLATYAPYFAVGIAMYTSATSRATFLRVPIVALVPAVAVAVLADSYTKGHGRVIGEASQLIETLMIWICVAAVLRLFQVLFPRDSRLTRALSDVAYTVFLFHHLVVVILGAALLGVGWGPWPKFLLVCAGGLAIPLLLHFTMIERWTPLRLLFNGK